MEYQSDFHGLFPWKYVTNTNSICLLKQIKGNSDFNFPSHAHKETQTLIWVGMCRSVNVPDILNDYTAIIVKVKQSMKSTMILQNVWKHSPNKRSIPGDLYPQQHHCDNFKYRTDGGAILGCKLHHFKPDCVRNTAILTFCALSVLTYLLTPWSRVLLEKLTSSAASQEIPHIFGTRRFITVLTSARHLSLS